MTEKKQSTSTSGGPDVEARTKELVEQGLSEEDAAEQAAYERKVWEDNQNVQA